MAGKANPQENRFAKANLLKTFEERDAEPQTEEKNIYIDPSFTIIDELGYNDFISRGLSAVIKTAKENSPILINGKTQDELFEDFLDGLRAEAIEREQRDYDLLLEKTNTEIIRTSINRGKKMGFQYHLTWNGFSKEMGYREKWKRAYYNKKAREGKRKGKNRQSELRKQAKKFKNF